tara:strand:- start:21079 stop:22134 length:1056 start_codon:yes stop_codon:yes gene_type:complete
MSLIATYLQDIRVSHPSNLDKNELRTTRVGLLEMALNQTSGSNSLLSPDLQSKAVESEGRNLDVPVMTKGSITIENTRSCTVGGGESDSALVRVVWKTVRVDIAMVKAQYAKNDVKYLYDLNKKIRESVEALNVEMESDLETALDASKSQVYGSTIVTSKYAVVANTIRATESQLDFFFNDLDAINFADDFYNDEVYVVGNHTIMPYVSKFVNQGGNNDENQSFQFAGKNFTFTNRITNGSGVNATGYFMPDGSIAMLSRVAIDARMGHKATDGTEWSEERIPGLPFPVGVMYKSSCSDQKALNGAGLEHLEATMVEHWQMSYDYAIVVPYNSDLATQASAIRKFEFIPNA